MNTAETPFDAQVQIDGLDLAKASFTSASSGIGGILKFNGNVNSNGKTAALSGAATIDQLKISPTTPAASRPVAANLAVAHDLKTRRGSIAKSTLKLGSASATVRADYNLAGKEASVDASLNGSKLPVSELLPFLPVFGVELPTGATLQGGTLSLDVTSRGAMDALTTSGDVKIEGAKLTGYNLGSKLRVIQDLAALPVSETTEIQTASTKFETSPSGTNLRDILFLAPTIGQLSGDGSITPKHALDFKMKAVVKTGGLLAAALQQRGETTTVPFFIQGTSASPVFKADVKALANEKLQQVVKNPEGAVKNAKEAVKTFQGIRDLFRKAPKQADQPQK
jgi:flagellin-like hook-associated protein FlgL